MSTGPRSGLTRARGSLAGRRLARRAAPRQAARRASGLAALRRAARRASPRLGSSTGSDGAYDDLHRRPGHVSPQELMPRRSPRG